MRKMEWVDFSFLKEINKRKIEMSDRKSVVQLVVLSFILLLSSPTYANHAWGNYHWERSENPFALDLGNNVDNSWEGYLITASDQWSVSTVLNTTVVPGSTSARRCKASTGKVEICNLAYGYNGWLGIAGITISGDHITSGYVKMNDSYFSSSTYNTVEWKTMVMCQEVGHIFGLNHQDENFSNPNLGTCMDYTNDPSTNMYPNAHDYEELETIYAHLDAASAGGGGDTSGGGCNPKSPKCNGVTVPAEWGRLISEHGPMEVFELDLGNGNKVITFVTWTLEHAKNHNH